MGFLHHFRHRHAAKRNLDNVAEGKNLQERDPQFGIFPVPQRGSPSPADDGYTYYSIIYVTASPTFDGPVAGYTTIDVAPPVQQTAAASSTDFESDYTTDTSYPTQTSSLEPAVTAAATTTAAASDFQTSIPEATETPQPAVSSQSSGMSGGAKAGLAIGIIIAMGFIAAGVLFIYQKKRKEMRKNRKSTAEKARFNPPTPAPMDNNSFEARPPPTKKTDSWAPMLSLRPISRLMPDLMSSKPTTTEETAPKTQTQGMHLAPPAAVGRSLTSPAEGQSPWERRQYGDVEKAENPFSDPSNPFVDQAKAPSPPPTIAVTPPNSNMSVPHMADPIVTAPIAKPTMAAPHVASPPSYNSAMALPVSSSTAPPPVASSNVPTPVNAVNSSTMEAAAGAGVAVAAGIASKGPSSPVREETALASPSPSYAVNSYAGSPSNSPRGSITTMSGNVYRIQMDFQPSMHDELELRSGQLVRMLHEYDDGWALCVRLDRSQQGVAPRTCLSQRPVKPRPMNDGPRQPGPRDPRALPIMVPNGRPMSPANSGRFIGPPPVGRPASPAGGSRYGSPANSRPMSPSSAPFNMTPRPLSPGPRPQPRSMSPGPRLQPRSMSPGPYGPGQGPRKMVAANQRRRSNSAGALDVRERRSTPPGPSPLAKAQPSSGSPNRQPVDYPE